MEYRYVIFEEWLGPKIFKILSHQTARLRNEYVDRKPQIFETLSEAKKAGLAIIERDVTHVMRLGDFSGTSAEQKLNRRREITDLTEDKVELFNC